jgi:3-deoxy-D-manno-octulosonic-acid transferase
MEAELWYMLFYTAKRKCEKTVLLNARISEKSFPKYLKFKWFYKRVFKNIDIVLAQSVEDKKRLEALGADNVEVTGNIKTFFEPEITTEYKKNKKLVVIASTHPGEEKLIMDNIDYKSYQIVVVPRHPERFGEVFELLKTYGNVSKISEICSGDECELRDDLILCDKMGELVNLYKVADAVILGGSFVDNVGGHNPVEAAYFQKPIISGKYIFNQKALYNEIDGIVQCEPQEVNRYLKLLPVTKIKNSVDLHNIIKIIKED